MKTSLSLLLAAVFILTGYQSGLSDECKFTLKPGENLADVQNQIRLWRQANPANQKKMVTLTVQPGEYFLAQPLEFTAADSYLTIKVDDTKSPRPVFTRGRKITGWQINDRGWFVTKIDDVASGKWWFENLFVNGQRARLAQTPNWDAPEGRRYFYCVKSSEDAPKRTFVCRDEQKELFNQLDALPNHHDIQVKFFIAWESSLHRFDKWDNNSNTVTLTGDSRWALDYWGPNLRYEICGIESALDQPGEFLLKRDGTLAYIPLPGQTIANTSFIAPDGPKNFEQTGFLKISGGVDNRATDIILDGLDFQCDVFTLPEEGLACNQAAVNSPVSILINYAQNIHLNNCSIREIGGYAVGFNQGCSDCSVEKCLLEDLGAGGIKIGTGHGAALDAPNLTQRCTAKNNIIRAYGRIDCGGIGIWIGNSPNNTVIHNDISDGYYTGISVGWIWGYSSSVAVNNTIQFNHIHHLGQGVLSDMGGVYTLGISPGTTVSNNLIHDIYSYNRYGRGGWGLYTDEGSSNILFENNLVYRTHTGSFHQHYGENNIVRNNILAFSKEEQIKRSRPENHLSFTFEHNIVVYENTPISRLFFGAWPDSSVAHLDKNLYWNYSGADKIQFFNGTFADWHKRGFDSDSIIADPCFADAQNNDFRFTPQSQPVLDRIGFKPFDFTQAGVLKDDANWINQAKNYQYKPVILTPDAPGLPPLTFIDRFDSKNKSVIKYTKKQIKASDGYQVIQQENNSFLRMTDNNSYQHAFEPFYSYSPAHKLPGVTRFSFDVRLSSPACLMAEFRDNNPGQYKIGPSIRIQNNVLSAGGKTLPCPAGIWNHVVITCPVGEGRSNQYFVDIQPTLSTNSPENNSSSVQRIQCDLPDAGWNLLEQLVLAALGTQDATIDLDNIQLEYSPR